MADQTQKLSFVEKAGYSAADAAANFVFMTMILFQTNFYTDVFGLTAGAAAAILLWPRLWDAFFDPIMGVLADRTKTRWGKFRPWVLWTAIPWSVVMILAYTTPTGWSLKSMIWYAAITNMMLMTLYSMNNMPYSALGGVMTGDLNERAKLNSFRFIAVNIAQFIVGGFTLPLVAKFAARHAGTGVAGIADKQYGWHMTMTVWAVLCLVLFLVTFLTTRERIQPPPQQKSSAKEDFANLLKNSPWRVMFMMTLVHFAILSFRGGALYNYYHHYADKGAMYDCVQKIGLTRAADAPSGGLLDTLGYIVKGDRSNLANSNVADVFNSLINMLGTGVTIIVILLSPGLSRRFGKKAVAVVGFGLAALGTFAFYLLSSTNTTGMVGLTVLVAVCYAPTIPLIWAIYADVADYSEWKTGRRFTGMVFATIGFALKSGLALGSASFLLIMKWFFNYDTTLPDASAAVNGFRACSGLVVGLLFAICTILLVIYQLNKRVTIQMADELAERREKIRRLAAGLNQMKPFIIMMAILSLAANVFAQTTLKDAYGKYFLIGAALNPSEFCESNAAAATLVKKQLNSISPENVLKWEAIHPRPGEFDFSLADRYVQFGVTNNMFIVGHNLIWHSQTPDWVFEDAKGNPVDRDTLLSRMREHIFTVVGRYKGKIGGWDVVNEALSENGQLRQSPWRKIIGEDYVVKAYQFAHEADPSAQLYYNDYGLESSSKQKGAIALIQKLQAEGVKVAGVGLQGHYRMDHPTTEQVDRAITAFSALGIKVMITEMDINFLPSAMRGVDTADVSYKEAASPELNPYTNGLPDAVQQQLAQRYASLFATFYTHRSEISRITFWGLTDEDSWLNDYPIKGRTAYPLLFGRDLRPKPAFNAVLRVVSGDDLVLKR